VLTVRDVDAALAGVKIKDTDQTMKFYHDVLGF
jgi:hypothetical protein